VGAIPSGTPSEIPPKQVRTPKLEQAKAETTAPSDSSIEPAAGYKSVLPEDDVIPDELVSDPCTSPEGRASLPGIVVGKTLRENLHLKLGDCMQVTFPTVGFSYSGGVVRAPVAKQFRVIAVFDAGFDQYDSKLVYTDLYQAQAFSDAGDTVTGIEMKLGDIDRSKQVAQEIERRLDNGIYHTMDWEELNHGLFTALRIQQILISLVLALIIVVAAFTVIATLIMVVLEKKREIAVLKAMGATNSALLRVFLYQGAFIGLVGTGLGLALGWATCRALVRYEFPLDPGVYFISHLPVRMQVTEFAMVGAFAILVCLFATVWPALYASRLRPADAFRSQD
jgi:lipoprotein-releasing system permease protein